MKTCTGESKAIFPMGALKYILFSLDLKGASLNPLNLWHRLQFNSSQKRLLDMISVGRGAGQTHAYRERKCMSKMGLISQV